MEGPTAVQERLDQLVKVKGKTHEAFASKYQIPIDTVKGWFRVDRVPGYESLATIANCTNVSLDWLLLGRGEMYYTNDAANQLFLTVSENIKGRGSDNLIKAKLKVLDGWGPATLWSVVVRNIDEILDTSEDTPDGRRDFSAEVTDVYEQIQEWAPEPDPTQAAARSPRTSKKTAKK